MKRKILLIAFSLTVAFVVALVASAHAGLWPRCDYYGGFMMGSGPDGERAKGSNCKCAGFKYYTVNEAPIDGTSHSVCFGIRTEVTEI